MDLELVRRVSVPRLVLELRKTGSRRGDGIGSLAEFLVDDLAQISLVSELAKAGRERLDELVQPLQVHLHLVIAVDDHIRLLNGIHALEPEAEKSSEELDCRLSRLAGATDERVALFL